MGGVYTEQRRITYYDLDFRGKFRLSAFLRMAHIAADNNAKKMGAGFNDLAPLGISFILQRFGTQISRMPQYDEEVTLRTWPASIEKGTFFRKGDIASLSGQRLMAWTSVWVLFDVAQRKILRPSALKSQLVGLGDLGVETDARKVTLPEDWGAAFSSFSHTVRYSEVDTNIHMNNCIYGDLIGNALYMQGEAAPDHNWTDVQINYLAETRLGETLDVVCRAENGLYFIAGKNGEKTAFTATVTCQN